MSNEGYNEGYVYINPNRLDDAPRNGASKSFENARVLPQQTSDQISFEREIKSIIDNMLKEGSFTPPAIGEEKRIMIHVPCGIFTESSGSGDGRIVLLTMKMSPLTDPIRLVDNSTNEITRLLTEFKITNHHVQDYLTHKFNEANLQNYSTQFTPQVPPPNSNNSDLLKQREQLPMYKYKKALLEAVQKNTVVIVSGGTGCGKTTQVPQFILEDAASRGEKVRIMCTQPRRSAAISHAKQVSKERGERLSNYVGYDIGFDSRKCASTILTFCTTEVLLRALSSDPSARGITHIILDEIHEREINMDYLLIYLKRCTERRTERRTDLKIILMSAAIEGNMNLFETYFQNSSVGVLRIESQLFDVQKYYLDEILAMVSYDPPNRPKSFEPNVKDYLKHAHLGAKSLAKKYVDINLVNEVIKYLADSRTQGSILVFLPGFDDILSVEEKVNKWKCGLKNYNQVNVICWHAKMHTDTRDEVFKKVPQNVRKIILTTNIAEAMPIEDVTFVIDTGKVEEKVFEHGAKISRWKISPIAKSIAKQRAGRAGRAINGYCFRLYGEKEFKEMPETKLAQMQTAAIYNVCLHARRFAPKHMKVAEFLALAPEPPHPEAIEQAMLFLEQIGAVTSQDKTKDPVLTDLGRIMASLPLDPQLARLLIFGIALKCFAPILNLVALLSYGDPFVLVSKNERGTMNWTKNQFGHCNFSDHLLYIRLVNEYIKCGPGHAEGFCRENYLSHSSMKIISKIREQLIQEVIQSKLIVLEPGKIMNTLLDDKNLNSFSNSWVMVQAAVAAGCYPYIGVAMGDENELRKIQTHAKRLSGLHESSHVKRQIESRATKGANDHNLQYVGYQEISMTDQGLALRCATVLPPATVLMFTGPIRMKHSIMEKYNIVTENGPYTEPVDQSFAPRIEEFEIESWYGIKAKREDIQHLLQLRFKFMHYFLKGLNDQHLFSQENYETMRLLKTINSVLNDEHKRIRARAIEKPELEDIQAPAKPSVPNPLHGLAGTKVEQSKQDATAYHDYNKNNMKYNQPKNVIPRQMNENINMLADYLVQQKSSESRHSSPGNGFQRQPMQQQYNQPMSQQPFTSMPMMQTALEKITDDLVQLDVVKRNYHVNGFNAVLRMENGQFVHLSQNGDQIRGFLTDKCE